MKNSWLLAVLTLLIAGCKKEVTELPPLSETGAQVFGAKVDDAFWVPKGFGIVPTAPVLEARQTGNDYFINARNFSAQPTETEFELYLKDVTGPGTYLLNRNTSTYPRQKESYAYFVERRLRPEGEWITGSNATGKIVLTKVDTENHILSGTFEFTARPMSIYPEKQPIRVTEGRFDLKVGQ